MKSFLLVVAGIIVGAVVTLVLASGIFTGVGIATGLKAGACLTVEAAKERGFITADQVDDVLNAAVKRIASANIGDEATLSGGDAECVKLVAELKSAAHD
jgi:hypothetical protein